MLLQQIKSDWENHGKDWTRPGFRALAYYRFGVWRCQVRPKLLRAPFSVLYRFLYRRARNLYGIEIPYSAKIGKNVVIEHQSGIVVHGNARIGDACIIRQGVTLGNRFMDAPQDAPELGEGVNVGAGAKILGKVVIGANSVVAANAVVLNDVPENHLAAGIPAQNRPLKSASNKQDLV